MTAGSKGDIKEFDKSMTNVLKAYGFGPASKKWGDFTKNSNYEMRLIEEGRIISSYEKALAKDYLYLGFETLFEGHKCLAVKYGYSGIGFFDILPEGLYDGFISFTFDGTQHVVSMYSKRVEFTLFLLQVG